jgi:acetaldehyde dehydrogenase (acetylating)
MSIHSRNEDVILEFGLKKPAFRICVNTPTTHGSIGLTTGLDPTMTLGCGGWGGNITSDNISPRHLLNIKRLAYEIRPAVRPAPPGPGPGRAAPSPPAPAGPDATAGLPEAPPRARERGIPAPALTARIDAFLASRGFRPESPAGAGQPPKGAEEPRAADNVEEFICEDDVRAAVRSGRKLLVGERTIVTPSARELGEAQKVFVQAGWPS